MTEKETTTGKVYDVGDVKIWRDGDTMYREMSGYVEMRPLYNEYEAGWPSLCGLATRAVAECIDLEPWLALVDAEAVEPEWARDDAEHVAAALGAPYADATSVQTLALLREGARMLWVGYTPGAVHVVADAWEAWRDLLIPPPPSGDWGDSSCFHWSFRSWDDVRVGGPGVTPLVAGVLQGTPHRSLAAEAMPGPSQDAARRLRSARSLR